MVAGIPRGTLWVEMSLQKIGQRHIYNLAYLMFYTRHLRIGLTHRLNQCTTVRQGAIWLWACVMFGTGYSTALTEINLSLEQLSRSTDMLSAIVRQCPEQKASQDIYTGPVCYILPLLKPFKENVRPSMHIGFC